MRKVGRAAETLAKHVRWCTVLALEDAEFKSKEFAERLIEVSVPKTVLSSEGSYTAGEQTKASARSKQVGSTSRKGVE